MCVLESWQQDLKCLLLTLLISQAVQNFESRKPRRKITILDKYGCDIPRQIGLSLGVIINIFELQFKSCLKLCEKLTIQSALTSRRIDAASLRISGDRKRVLLNPLGRYLNAIHTNNAQKTVYISHQIKLQRVTSLYNATGKCFASLFLASMPPESLLPPRGFDALTNMKMCSFQGILQYFFAHKTKTKFA